MEQQLINAALDGKVEEVEALLRDNPGLDVNWLDSNSRTPLHCAADGGHSEIVKLFLAHPMINVNIQSLLTRQTPACLCCENGWVEVVRLFLKDPRTTFADDNGGCSPLWWASYWGHCEVVEWLIASGRELGT